MRFPTSVISAPAATRAQGSNENLDIYRDAVQPQIDEPVIEACLFSRQGMMTEKLAGHFGGGLTYLLARKHSQMRAGGLPQHFIIAVTQDRVYAIETKVGARRGPAGEIRGEVARWERASLRVSSKTDMTTGGLGLNVTIESPAEGETVRCTVGRNRLSEDFVRLLSDHEATV